MTLPPAEAAGAAPGAAAPRVIAVVTGTRAEYGLLSGAVALLAADPRVVVRLVVTGAHLSPRFGHTVEAIRADGLPIAAEVPCLAAGDRPLDVARALGAGVGGLAETFDRLRPDLVVVLGDRYEILAAAQAALMLGIPLAHLHGGEVTEGAIDESIRHAVSKMASLHLVAAPSCRDRLIRMGEMPERIRVVGAPGAEAARTLPRLDPAELDQALGLKLHDPLLLVTYHPATRHPGGEEAAARALTGALDRFPAARVVVTGVNADAGNAAVTRVLGDWVAAHPDRASLHASLGQRRYLAVMARAAAVVGNSSSGLIEAPALGVPTVDLGDRQRGRPRAASVISCAETVEAIATAIARALDPAFRAAAAATEPPYGRGHGTAAAIAAILATHPLAGLTLKPFYEDGGGGWPG